MLKRHLHHLSISRPQTLLTSLSVIMFEDTHTHTHTRHASVHWRFRLTYIFLDTKSVCLFSVGVVFYTYRGIVD